MKSTGFVTGLDKAIEETAVLSHREIEEMRPFICDGSPLDCRIFTVGLNPASKVSWQSFWNKETGNFDKVTWYETYKTQRLERKRKEGKLRAKPVSTTRKRIELINAALGPLKALETNIYSFPTASGADLMPQDRLTLIFDFLLNTIKPRLLHIHGDDAIGYFETKVGKIAMEKPTEVDLGYGPVMIFATPHLTSRGKGMTDERVRGWGTKLRELANQ